MLAWNKLTHKSQLGLPASESFEAVLPGWGAVSIHTHIHCPGLFLTCDSLGIEMHPLGPLAL